MIFCGPATQLLSVKHWHQGYAYNVADPEWSPSRRIFFLKNQTPSRRDADPWSAFMVCSVVMLGLVGTVYHIIYLNKIPKKHFKETLWMIIVNKSLFVNIYFSHVYKVEMRKVAVSIPGRLRRIHLTSYSGHRIWTTPLRHYSGLQLLNIARNAGCVIYYTREDRF